MFDIQAVVSFIQSVVYATFSIKFWSAKDTSDIPDVLSAINETGLCLFCEEERPLLVSLTSSEVTVFTQYKRKLIVQGIAYFVLQ